MDAREARRPDLEREARRPDAEQIADLRAAMADFDQQVRHHRNRLVIQPGSERLPDGTFRMRYRLGRRVLVVNIGRL